MTTRLTRWLNTLDNFEEKMSLLPAVRRYGRLTRATGLVLEATGYSCRSVPPASLNVRTATKPGGRKRSRGL
jgi:flagellar biosynthesis/type III secretory pathway ATPase